jgi:hypothetical protein
MLYSDKVGGIFLVTKQFFKDGLASPPYITIVAAPALATLGQFSTADPPGISTPNYWDNSVLAPFNVQMRDGQHCPMLATAEGFSCLTKLPGATEFLNDAQPLFSPLGEQLAGRVPTTTTNLSHAFFLP